VLAAVVAGEVQMVADASTTSNAHPIREPARAGDRHVPTTPEAGYPKLQAPFWLGVVAPAGTPPAIIDKLNAAFRDSIAQPETRVLLNFPV
jgi:tripartite-type tricarboxylate transporter receptor subunit TctC